MGGAGIGNSRGLQRAIVSCANPWWGTTKGLRSGTINAVGIIHWARQWSKHCQKNWHSMWESVNQVCFDGLAEKVHVPNACDWIVLARMKPELQDRFRERVDFSNGSACSSGLVSSTYGLLFDNPEEIVRLSF